MLEAHLKANLSPCYYPAGTSIQGNTQQICDEILPDTEYWQIPRLNEVLISQYSTSILQIISDQLWSCTVKYSSKEFFWVSCEHVSSKDQEIIMCLIAIMTSCLFFTTFLILEMIPSKLCTWSRFFYSSTCFWNSQKLFSCQYHISTVAIFQKHAITESDTDRGKPEDVVSRNEQYGTVWTNLLCSCMLTMQLLKLQR